MDQTKTVHIVDICMCGPECLTFWATQGLIKVHLPRVLHSRVLSLISQTLDGIEFGRAPRGVVAKHQANKHGYADGNGDGTGFHCGG